MPFDEEDKRYRCALCCCCSAHSKKVTIAVAVIEAILFGLNFAILLPVLLVTGLAGGDFYAAVANLALLALPAIALLLLICGMRRESAPLVLPFLAIQALVLLLFLGLTAFAAVRTAEGWEHWGDGDASFAGLQSNASTALHDLTEEERAIWEGRESGRKWGLVMASLGAAAAVVFGLASLVQAWVFSAVHKCFLCFRHKAGAARSGGGGGEGKELLGHSAAGPSAPPPYSADAPLYPEMKEIM